MNLLFKAVKFIAREESSAPEQTPSRDWLQPSDVGE
jgi:hypothetical protein